LFSAHTLFVAQPPWISTPLTAVSSHPLFSNPYIDTDRTKSTEASRVLKPNQDEDFFVLYLGAGLGRRKHRCQYMVWQARSVDHPHCSCSFKILFHYDWDATAWCIAVTQVKVVGASHLA